MIDKSRYRNLVSEGVWRNNPALVQLLGLCPLLAVSSTVVNGLGMGIATTLTLLISNTTVALVRNLVPPEVRIPVFVLIIACAVTIIEMMLKAWFHELYLILGIFIPLIVTNCVIIGRAEAFASRNPVSAAAVDGIAMGVGFTAVLAVLGGLREVVGSGTVFANIELLFGERMRFMTVVLSDDYPGVLLAILPPGAFIGLGLLLALKNVVDRRRATRAHLPLAHASQTG